MSTDSTLPAANTEADEQTMVFPTGTVTITHGGQEGTQAHAVVIDDDVVVNAVLLPADWAHQDPATRWSPGAHLDLVVLDDDEAALAVPGARRVDGAWLAPEPPVLERPDDAEPTATGLVALVDALRALTPAQTVELQQLLAAPGPPS